jgi:carboxypeptidase C (cathepsin A)
MKSVAVLSLFITLIAALRLSDIARTELPSLGVTQHYGYINVNKTMNANLFYWMFESQGTPSKDPVVLWMTGGPGCSSELALFFENGPYTMGSDGKPQANPYSWNKFTNLVYIDQPVGTGFSYAKSDYVHDEAAVATEMYSFLQEFFKKFPQYQQQDFYIVGESYGGHYVPTVALRTLIGNHDGKGLKINLKGIGIGNGWVSPRTQYAGYGPFAYENGIIDRSTFSQMNATLTTCQNLIDQKRWGQASAVCSGIMGAVLQYAGNLNVYNIKLQCNPAPLCYDFSAITNYLNSASVQKSLGVYDQGITWETCNYEVNSLFGNDVIESFRYEIPSIMAYGVKVVVYNGDLDLICNWVGGKMWVEGMSWPGKAAFNAAPMKTWHVHGTPAGQAKTAQGLTFVRVYQAGHMVPHDQPENALDLLSHIVKNTPFA